MSPNPLNAYAFCEYTYRDNVQTLKPNSRTWSSCCLTRSGVTSVAV
jgi:hypothetical protein